VSYSFHQRTLVTVMQIENTRNQLIPVKRNTTFNVIDKDGQVNQDLAFYLVSPRKDIHAGERVILARHLTTVSTDAGLVVDTADVVVHNDLGQAMDAEASASPLTDAVMEPGVGETVVGDVCNSEVLAWKLSANAWKEWLAFNKVHHRDDDYKEQLYVLLTGLVVSEQAKQLELTPVKAPKAEGVYLAITTKNELIHYEHKIDHVDPTKDINTIPPRPLETRSMKANQLVPLWPTGKFRLVRDYVKTKGSDDSQITATVLVICNAKHINTHRQLVQFTEQNPEQCEVYLLAGNSAAIPADVKFIGSINLDNSYNVHTQRAEWWWDKVDRKFFYMAGYTNAMAVDSKSIKLRRQKNLVLMDVSSPNYQRAGIRQLIKRPFRLTDDVVNKSPLIYSVSPCGIYKLFHNLEEQLEQCGYIAIANVRK
jgi:hypothetical protein